jgi:hypothetical protein
MGKKLDEMTVEELEDFVFNVMDDVLDYDTSICDLAVAVAKALKAELES